MARRRMRLVAARARVTVAYKAPRLHRKRLVRLYPRRLRLRHLRRLRRRRPRPYPRPERRHELRLGPAQIPRFALAQAEAKTTIQRALSRSARTDSTPTQHTGEERVRDTVESPTGCSKTYSVKKPGSLPGFFFVLIPRLTLR